MSNFYVGDRVFVKESWLSEKGDYGKIIYTKSLTFTK